MNLNIRLSIVSVVIALATCSVVVAQEKKITRAQLPPAVEKTVARESQGATINGFATEIENGKRLYEVELTVDGGKRVRLIGGIGVDVRFGARDFRFDRS